MARITKCEAKRLAKKAGIKFDIDSAKLSISQKSDLAAIAKLKGYRKSKNSSGSTGRAFFNYLKKVKSC